MAKGRWQKILIGVGLLPPLLMACGILSDTPTPTTRPTPAFEAGGETLVVPTPLTTPLNTAPAETAPPGTDGEPTESATTAGVDEPTTAPTVDTSGDGQTTSSIVAHDLSIEPGGILLLPAPAVYAGDLVTFHIAPKVPRGLAPNVVQVRVLLDGEELHVGNLNYRKLSGDVVGLYQWAWDTTDQEGTHTITVELDPQDLIQINDEDPGNNTASLDMIVRPRELLPTSQADASWIEADSDCCRLHFISGTAAQRDIEQLKDRVDTAFESAAATLTTQLSSTPYDVYIADRVIGQGGYAVDDMVISYLDRDYVGGGLEELLAHEAVHLIDHDFAPDRITFLSEGLAVWAAGGHYQQQDLAQRMAALLEIGGYVPLGELVENFFAVQHEISYLESGSLIDYLVATYGWPQVRDFYSNTSAADGFTVTDAVDINMREAFGRTLEQVEADWLAYVSSQPQDPAVTEALRMTIRYYDVMRRYQTLYDHMAYYLHAWLPLPADAAERQTTADFSRHPESETNIALETMLLSANDLLWQGQYDRVNALLDSVNRVLNNDGKFLDPLARSYLQIVRAAADEGYTVQRIELNGNQASADVSRPGSAKIQSLEFVMNNDRSWSIRR